MFESRALTQSLVWNRPRWRKRHHRCHHHAAIIYSPWTSRSPKVNVSTIKSSITTVNELRWMDRFSTRQRPDRWHGYITTVLAYLERYNCQRNTAGIPKCDFKQNSTIIVIDEEEFRKRKKVHYRRMSCSRIRPHMRVLCEAVSEREKAVSEKMIHLWMSSHISNTLRDKMKEADIGKRKERMYFCNKMR